MHSILFDFSTGKWRFQAPEELDEESVSEDESDESSDGESDGEFEEFFSLPEVLSSPCAACAAAFGFALLLAGPGFLFESAFGFGFATDFLVGRLAAEDLPADSLASSSTSVSTSCGMAERGKQLASTKALGGQVSAETKKLR